MEGWKGAVWCGPPHLVVCGWPTREDWLKLWLKAYYCGGDAIFTFHWSVTPWVATLCAEREILWFGDHDEFAYGTYNSQAHWAKVLWKQKGMRVISSAPLWPAWSKLVCISCKLLISRSSYKRQSMDNNFALLVGGSWLLQLRICGKKLLIICCQTIGVLRLLF